MPWGAVIWGSSVWSSGPASENLSFEVADAAAEQGIANGWIVASQSPAERIASFGDTGLVWEAFESFDAAWRNPLLVHEKPDTVNVVTAPDATDQQSAGVLLNAFIPKFGAHLLTAGYVHLLQDIGNFYSSGVLPETNNPGPDEIQLLIAANSLLPAYLNHLDTFPAIHGKWDILNGLLYAFPVSDVPSLILFVNDLKAKFNSHVVQQGYGNSVTAATFAFAQAALSAFTLQRGVRLETFEFMWAPGHEELRSVWEYLVSTSIAPERMEGQWLLPGAYPAAPNELFLAKYWSGTEWRFRDTHLALGVAEDFEAGWKNNDVGLAKHWSGTEWRFLPAQLISGVYGEYVFATLNLGTPTQLPHLDLFPALASHSPNVVVAVVEEIGTGVPQYDPSLAYITIAVVQMDFKDKNDAAQTCYWHIERGDNYNVGDITRVVSLTGVVTDPRFVFGDVFAGIKEITALFSGTAVGGVIDVVGSEELVESFSNQNWILDFDA